MAPRILAGIVAVIVVGLIALSLLTNFLVDWTWFSSLGYLGVFWTTIAAKAALFAAVFVATAVLIWVNAEIAHRSARVRGKFRLVNSSSPWGSIEGLTPPPILERITRHFPWQVLIAASVLVLAWLIASAEVGDWDMALKFVYQIPSGQRDPMFGRDFGFYLFSLPAYIEFKNWMLVVLVVSAIAAGALYWAHGAIVLDVRRAWISPAAITHGSVLLGLIFLVEAWAYWLDRYDLVYGDNGVVVGASYTDVHVRLPILIGLAIACVLAAIAAFVNTRVRSWRIPVMAIGVVVVAAFVLAPVAEVLFQRLFVKPNELAFEAPYIARNIALTREAYKLRQIEVKPFPAEQTLSYASLENNRATVDNIRLWDWQPLLDTYAQLQEIRTYYKFHDADIDRYTLSGSYQQVMLSARELEPSLLPENAQTWVNLHVLFTHGDGVVMSPVTRTTPEGLPIFYLKDIPPIATGGPEIREPRIYFGEAADNYVVVRGSSPEFDYPKGDKNVYAFYNGADGVPIGGLASRLLYAWYFSDINILLSGYITGESRIMFRRNIQERVRELAPFLVLDNDPYMVISGGRLYWIQDAYTVSNWFPFSKAVSDGSANYVRNSVKVVIDAYNGTTNFYVSDPSDPIVETYAHIFPKLFKPLAAMPPDLQKHIRYPEDLFELQAQIYAAYHMDTPEVFYNREDLWQFPRQPAGIGDDDVGDAKMSPYYINMRLPDESKTEFVLMLPMVPSQRENMIAWLAARCDQPGYGKLIVYEFPKEKLIYGPYQVEALINQNTDISQQISLWNQMGSRVIRGNLLVVPIDNSILYVTPLYLRAQSGQLPELKRVIAIYGDHVVMENTLAEALAALFPAPAGSAGAIGESGAAGASGTAPSAAGASAEGAPSPSLPALSAAAASSAAHAALDHYERAIAKLKAGDWSGFGAELDALHPLLEQLNASRAPASAPGAGSKASR